MFSLSDILGEQAIVCRREEADTLEINRIANMDPEDMRAKLLDWAMKGLPAQHSILELTMPPPIKCKDLVTRTMPEYVLYISGKTVEQHVAELQAKFVDILAGFTYTPNTLIIHVTKNLASTPM